jgi:hypothetical protein
LEAIKREGSKIAIATDCTDPVLRHYRAVLDVDDLIDVIVCGEDVEERQTEPETRPPGSAAFRYRPASSGYDRGHAVRCRGRARRGCLRLGSFDRRVSHAALKDAGCYAAIKEVGEMQKFLATRRISRVEETPVTPGFS